MMKIFGVNFFEQKNKIFFKENNNNLYLCRNKLERTPASDTVSFTSKIPSIVAPTMEDLINRTKAVDILRYNVLRLAKYDIPCPVCGHLMLDVEKFREFEQNVLNANSPKEILECIEPLKKYLHPLEAKIFKMLKEDNQYYPKLTLFDILKKRLPSSEKKIIQMQTNIFSNIGLMSRKLPTEQRLKVQDLLTETFARVLDPRDTSRFSRRIFINKLKYLFFPEEEQNRLTLKFIEEYKNNNYRRSLQEYIEERMAYEIANWHFSQEERAIIEESLKLPMAYNNFDAFIVKYSKRDYKNSNPDKKIVIRMLSNSLATVEHIKPQSKRGATEPKNLAIECACDNNNRGSSSVLEQIIEHPKMQINYLRYMKRLCQIHLKGKVEKSYITQQDKTYREESLGILDSDLSLLRFNKKKSKNRGFKNNNSIGTPTKAERRAAKKQKMKLKKHKNEPKNKNSKVHIPY